MFLCEVGKLTKRLLQCETFFKKCSLVPEMFELLGSANKSIKAQIHLKHHQSKMKNRRDQLVRGPVNKREEKH